MAHVCCCLQIYPHHDDPSIEQRTVWVCTVADDQLVDGKWSGDFEGSFVGTRVAESTEHLDVTLKIKGRSVSICT